MNIILEKEIKKIKETELNNVLTVCDEWMEAYNLKLTRNYGKYVLTNENDNKEVFSEELDDVLEYIAELIKIAMEKADFYDYLNMAEDYEILTGNNLIFSLCISETCKECNGINVTCLNKNLYKCNHTNNILYKSEEDTLIHIDLLNSPNWLNRVSK